jgi:DNA-binding NarL/FixJ family response regulator
MTSSQTCRVAVCDDMVDFRRVLVAWIERADGFCVVGEAGNGRDAVELARAEQPDVMLLDLSMPVMDGMAALPLIRAAAPETQVIVLTGLASADIRRRAIERGAIGYLEKGERPSVVVAAVKEAWARRG